MSRITNDTTYKYISCSNHIFLYSDDNWTTFTKIRRQSISGIEESDADTITEVKLRYNLGEKFAQLIINEFKKIRSEFNFQIHDGYGHAFEIFALATIYNIDYRIAYQKYIIHGSNDGKIDAIYWKDKNKIILYQIKIDYLDLNDLAIMKHNYFEFITTNNISSHNSSDLLAFCHEHQDNLLRETEFDIVTISNNNNSPKNILSNDIYKKYLENILINRENKVSLTLKIPVSNGVTKLSNTNTVYGYITSAKAFIEDILNCENINQNSENLYKLFFDNVRGNLGINKDLANTITKEPNNFIKYNNGITITGKVSYKESTKTIIVEDPIINNGQQTIWNLLDQYPNLENINLMIIVKNEFSSRIKGKISRYTNTQRLIKPLDLLSLDTALRDLQRKIFSLTIKEDEEHERLFLEINTSGIRNYDKVIKKLYTKEEIISLSDFCKLYFSIIDDTKMGDWKSSISSMISTLLNQEIVYNLETSISVCQTICNYKKYLNTIEDKNIKNTVKTADLAFMYIMLKYNISAEKTHQIINKLNNKYFYSIAENERRSKLIDLYKSNSIIDMINNVVRNNK